MSITSQLLPVLDFSPGSFKTYDELVDHVEKAVVDNLPLMELPLVHRVTPGLYTREMFAPAGTFLTSLPHRTEHQFFVSQGEIIVYQDDKWQRFKAPCHGISKPGTRRMGFVVSDVIWTTIHATPLAEDKKYTQEEFIQLIGDIEKDVLDDRNNELLTENKEICHL